MKQLAQSFFIYLFLFIGTSLQLSAQTENLPIYPGKFKPTDESLKMYQYMPADR